MYATNRRARYRKYFLLFLCAGLFAVAGCSGKYTRTVPEGTSVTSSSAVFQSAAKSLLEPCSLPAEFGRCGCTLDGLQTSCDIVHRCVENGFCVVVRE
jgi:hypothetical protein